MPGRTQSGLNSQMLEIKLFPKGSEDLKKYFGDIFCWTDCKVGRDVGQVLVHQVSFFRSGLTIKIPQRCTTTIINVQKDF